MTLKIEKIQEHDFDDLITLFLEFATFQQTPEKMTNSHELMLRDKDYIHGFVARDENNNIVGYVTMFYAYYTWVGKSLYMDDLYVCERYRGKGLGTALINKVISAAKDENCSRLRWQVSSWNEPAIAFYKSLGAKIDDVEMNCDIIF